MLALCIFLSMSLAHAADKEEIFSLIESGDLKDANAYASKMLQENPDDPELIFAQALIAEKSGRTEQAVEIYQSLTRSNPELLAPYNNLAIHHARSGNYQAAIDTLERAMESQPAIAVAYRNLTAIYAQLASAAYRKALNSSEPLAPLNLASMDNIESLRGGEFRDQPTLVASVENFVNETLQSAASVPPSSEDNVKAVAIEVVQESNDEPAQKTESEIVLAENSAQPEVEQTKVAEEIVNEQPKQPDPVQSDNSNEQALAKTKTEATPEPIVIASVTPVAEAKQAVENNAAQKQALINHIESWAAAWSDRDVERYLSHYSNKFSPRNNLSLEEWKKQRHGRLRWREFIVVKPSKYSINIDGNTATVNFNQYYKSDRFEDTIRKTMKLDNENGRWLITRELI